jgi:hypothetical protein
MIDVVQALVLFEICAEEMAAEDASGARDTDRAGRRRMTLTARALAKRELDVAHLSRYPHRDFPHDAATPDQPPMTLGAMIVFRTADKFGRAGASTTHTLDAVYRAAQRYVELLPNSLQDGTDKIALGVLLGNSEESLRLGRCPRSLGTGVRTSIVHPTPTTPAARSGAGWAASP